MALVHLRVLLEVTKEVHVCHVDMVVIVTGLSFILKAKMIYFIFYFKEKMRIIVHNLLILVIQIITQRKLKSNAVMAINVFGIVTSVLKIKTTINFFFYFRKGDADHNAKYSH